jgi:uncharacterized membrane protein
MAFSHPPSTAAITGQPIHAMLVPFPIVAFTLAFLTDIAFWQTSNLMWQNFSAWLLFAGMVDLLFSPEVRAQRPAWPHAIGNLIVLGLAFLNSLVHAGDGWTAVVPYGLILSAVTVLLIFVTAWLGRSMVFRHGVGVSMSDHSSCRRASAFAGSCLVVLALAGCGDSGEDFDLSSQIGPDPVLPEPSSALLPALKVAEVVGWQDGETPTVPEGLSITPYAKDLANPRTVHTLPNGDILVV